MRSHISNGSAIYNLRGYRVPASKLRGFNDSDITISNPFEVDIPCEIVKSENGDHFRIIRGVTGYEKWEMERLLNDPRGGDFVACAGTEFKYDRLVIYRSEWDEFVKLYKELKELGCQS